MQRVIGIDPGSRLAGYGVIDVDDKEMRFLEAGVVDLRKRSCLAERLHSLDQELDKLFCRWSPAVAVIEKVFLGKNPESAFILGHARGVCLSLVARHRAEFVEYATRSVKKGVSGRGSATKEELQLLLQAEFSCQIPQLDATDALALAVCHGRQMQVQGVIQGQHSGWVKDDSIS